MIFFDKLYDSRSGFDGSMSIHTLSLNGMVVVPVYSSVEVFLLLSIWLGTYSSSCVSARLCVSYLI